MIISIILVHMMLSLIHFVSCDVDCEWGMENGGVFLCDS